MNQQTLAELEARVRGILTDDLGVMDGETGPEDDLFEAGLDSMAIMQLLLRLEGEFGVSIPLGELSRRNFATLRAIVALVAAKTGVEP